MSATSLTTESSTGELWEIFKNIYFADACKGLPLKGKIFAGVSFLIILGFAINEADHSFTMKELHHFFR